MLRRYLYLAMVALLAALPFSLASCGGDDDDDDAASGSAIVGTWELTGTSAAFGESTSDEVYMQLKKDGTFIQVEVDEDDEGIVSRGTWSQNGSTFSYTLDGTFSFQILNLTGKTMKLSFVGGLATFTFSKVSDSTIKKYLNEDTGSSSGGKLTVNGTTWEANANFSPNPGFTDHYSGSGSFYYLSANFYRKGALLFADELGFSFSSRKYVDGKYVYVDLKEGMDISDFDEFSVSYDENMYQEQDKNKPWKTGEYDEKASGHAYVKKYEKNKKLVIQFSNLKMKLTGNGDAEYDPYSYDYSHPKTLTLNGTITYRYED